MLVNPEPVVTRKEVLEKYEQFAATWQSKPLAYRCALQILQFCLAVWTLLCFSVKPLIPHSSKTWLYPRRLPRTCAERRAVISDPIPLTKLRRIREKHQVTVNDIMVAAVAGALRRYAIEVDKIPAHQVPDASAVVMCDVRSSLVLSDMSVLDGLDNYSFPYSVQIPNSASTSVERLARSKRTMDWAKLTSEPILLCKLQDFLAGLLPMGVLCWILDRCNRKYDVLFTNVKGLDGGMILKSNNATHKVRASMFWVSGAPTVVSASLTSLDGMAQMNLLIDGNMIKDPQTLAEYVSAEVDSLESSNPKIKTQ
eukprot:TRINITY_DN470_c0_g1_i2.p2 TRINITY_DN470_c0_g1~~TRINITY_DN470_c0_g1_i2.p2  ORF type:complete len:311 (-),score=66.54 TRINITY_DN470_c0_g1_i2:1069-2001(-)